MDGSVEGTGKRAFAFGSFGLRSLGGFIMRGEDFARDDSGKSSLIVRGGKTSKPLFIAVRSLFKPSISLQNSCSRVTRPSSVLILWEIRRMDN